MRKAWFARGDAQNRRSSQAHWRSGRRGSSSRSRRLSLHAWTCLDEVGVPHRRAEDHDSWLVPAPHITPQLRDPRWRRAGLRSEDARLDHLAEVRCDAAVFLYGVRSCVESLPRTIGCRHDVEIVQEGQQRIVWVQGGCRAVQRFVLPARASPCSQPSPCWISRWRTAGSIMRRGRASFTIAIACCCLPWNRLPRHFFARKAGHMEGLGWQQCPASQHSHWPHKPCSSRCGAERAVRRPPTARPRRVRSNATWGCDVLRCNPRLPPHPGRATTDGCRGH